MQGHHRTDYTTDDVSCTGSGLPEGQVGRGLGTADRAHAHPGRARRDDRLADGGRQRDRGHDRHPAALHRPAVHRADRDRRLTRKRRAGRTGAALISAGSAGATRASGTPLERAALVLGQAAPDARVLTGLEGVLKADLGHGAASADRLRLLDLVDGRSGVPHGEEQFGDRQSGMRLCRASP